MKSLEIVNTAKIKPVAYGSCVLHSEELETIKQDLEVLEILRKYMELSNGIIYKADDMEGVKINLVCFENINDLDTKEDYNKLKQWLEENENDK